VLNDHLGGARPGPSAQAFPNAPSTPFFLHHRLCSRSGRGGAAARVEGAQAVGHSGGTRGLLWRCSNAAGGARGTAAAAARGATQMQQEGHGELQRRHMLTRRQRCRCFLKFFIAKIATPLGEEPLVMARSIAIDPNPTAGQTGGEGVQWSGETQRVRIDHKIKE